MGVVRVLSIGQGLIVADSHGSGGATDRIAGDHLRARRKEATLGSRSTYRPPAWESSPMRLRTAITLLLAPPHPRQMLETDSRLYPAIRTVPPVQLPRSGQPRHGGEQPDPIVAFGCSAVGVGLARSRSDGTGLASLLAKLALVPLTASLAGRIRRWFDLAATWKGFTLRNESLNTLIGRRGRALTPLRPAGSVEFGGRRVDGLSEGDFIEAGTPVTGIRVRGRYLLVRVHPDPLLPPG
jgi:hypothetical protein